MSNNEYRQLPAIDKLIETDPVKSMILEFGRERVIGELRKELDDLRTAIANGQKAPPQEIIIDKCRVVMENKFKRSLTAVINGTGIVLHTNLGRSPLGEKVVSDLAEVTTGYSNLEFDLDKGKRGHRNNHIRAIMRELTGAENAIAVNNNAAAVFLILKTIAEGKEVIISRSEQIEIGGSFRIPDIMAASGAIMKEVGCTNRTKLSDYEKAITENTGAILKAHKSNYYIGGFTEEAELEQLVELAHNHNLPMIFDLGSGLLRKPAGLPLEAEPDVKSALSTGCDIVSFSGDKLLGGPQAGIIAGKEKYIQKLEKAPLMRALRVGKLTISALLSVMNAYLKDEDMLEYMPIFGMLSKTPVRKKELAEYFLKKLNNINIKAEISESMGRCGGGTLPHLEIPSFSVKLILPQKGDSAEKLFYQLLQDKTPVLSILREGELHFDILCLNEKNIDRIADILSSKTISS